MKQLFLIALLVIGMIASAQTYSLVSSVSKVADKIVIIDLGVATIDAMVTADGNYYINRVSKETGNEYKQYLGYKTEDVFSAEGYSLPVFTNKECSKFWVHVIGKTGYPSKRMLNKQ